MNKHLKKLLCASLSLAMVAGSIVLPMSASAEIVPIFEGDEVLNEWKFDFGAADVAPEEGWIRVDPTANFVDSGKQYGFIGNNEYDWELPTDRWDGFVQQQGQIIELAAGGGEGEKDGIGVVGAGGTAEQGGVDSDLFGNKADKYYPVRFTMGAKDDSYYRVRATVTTFDQTKPAVASLYTERKHPLYTEKTIAAGETVVTEWTVRPTPVYYKGPKQEFADEMVNIGLIGENTALVSIEIQEVKTAPVLWVLGDSTTTDGGGSLPFWPLQNFTGDGSGITKYLPAEIAMVNEGEGGLNSTDKEHFDVAKNRIKAGDFMWVEYGHNDSNVDSYKGQLYKYYDACKDAQGGEATLILVGPLDRVMRSGPYNQYTPATNTWKSTLSGYSDAAKAYVDAKLAANPNDKIAFVDLNQPSLDWYTSVTRGEEYEVEGEDGTETAYGTLVAGKRYANDARLIDYYFQTYRGANSPDTTHPNDLGGENLAYLFFATGDDETYPALAPLLKRYKDGEAEQPTAISQDVMDLGFAANSAWPAYQPPVAYDYPTVVKDVVLNDDNEFVSMEVLIQDSFSNYASGVVEVLNSDGEVEGTYITYDHLDNTNAKGTYTLSFAAPEGEEDDYVIPALEEDQTYRAYIWTRPIGAISDVKHTIMSEEDGGIQLSAIYTPTDIEAYLLPGSAGGIEDFNYRGSSKLTDNAKWIYGGSNGSDFTLGKDGDRTYTTVKADGTGSANSWTLRRAFENVTDGTGYEGKYMVDFEINYSSGSNAAFILSEKENKGSPFLEGARITMFTIGANGVVTIDGKEAGTLPVMTWVNVKYIIDMDRGVASLSVAGGDPVEISLPVYDTFDIPDTASYRFFGITQTAAGTVFDFKMANLTVAKLKQKLPEKTATVSVAEGDEAKGTVEIGEAGQAQTGYTLSYKDGKALVGSNKTGDVVLVEAKYANGALTDVTPTLVTFEEAGIQKIAAAEGSRLMLWDSLEGINPLAPAITAEESDDDETDTSITNKLNTLVTVKAVPNDGFAFAGWKSNGTVVSTSAIYTFRLHDNIDLVASFVKDPEITDIANYALEAEQGSMKGVKGSTVQVNIVNVVDADGIPVTKATNADVTWSADAAGVTVVNGLVTIGDDFDMGGAEEKTITVTAVLNGVTKTTTIVANVYDYYENFNADDFAKTGWFANVNEGSSYKIEGGELKMTAGGDNKLYMGVHFTTPEKAAGKLVTIKYDYTTTAVDTSTNKTSHLFLANLGLTENSPTWDIGSKGTSFQNKIDINIEANTKYEVTIVINNKTKTGTVTAQPASGEAATLTLANTSDVINTIFFRPGRNITDTVDNFRVIIADAE